MLNVFVEDFSVSDCLFCSSEDCLPTFGEVPRVENQIDH